jgi:hypothetical protein
MVVLDLVLYLLAAVMFGLAVFNVPARWNLVALGLLFWVMAPLLHAIAAVA